MKTRTLDRNVVERLEKELERAIADVIARQADLPVGPDRPTMHYMAKAAMAAYEAAVRQAVSEN